MTRFKGGPAEGHVLTLQRSPYYLRVVRVHGSTKVDALDQLDDTPRHDETVWVYRLIARHGTAFIDKRDAQGRRTGHRAEMATYELLDPQPQGQHLRDIEAWQAWTNGPGRKLAKEHHEKKNPTNHQV